MNEFLTHKMDTKHNFGADTDEKIPKKYFYGIEYVADIFGKTQ